MQRGTVSERDLHQQTKGVDMLLTLHHRPVFQKNNRHLRASFSFIYFVYPVPCGPILHFDSEWQVIVSA